MTGWGLLTLPAITLLAAGTPRQTAALFGAHVGRPARRTLRLAGWAMLALSFVLAMQSDDRSRTFILWVSACGIEALLLALGFTLLHLRRPGT